MSLFNKGKTMIQKIRTYINNKYPDRISKCNAIGRLLKNLVCGSIAVLLALSGISWLKIILFDVNTFNWLSDLFGVLFIILMFILIYASKCALVVLPIVWFIQCVDCIKNKKYNDEILRNLLFWILLALLSLYIYNDNKATDECMAKCVLPDNSNYDDCRANTCDFPI